MTICTLVSLVAQSEERRTNSPQRRRQYCADAPPIMARNRGAQSRIDAAEDHIKASGKDIRLVVDHGNLTALFVARVVGKFECRPAPGA